MIYLGGAQGGGALRPLRRGGAVRDCGRTQAGARRAEPGARGFCAGAWAVCAGRGGN
jgi:hypothetical protein